MSNDYKKVFMSNIHKLLTEGEDYSWMEDEDELPPTEYTDDQKKAIDKIWKCVKMNMCAQKRTYKVAM